MDLADINVLIYAHREDSPEHERYTAWLRRLVSGASPFALSSFTLGLLADRDEREDLRPADSHETWPCLSAISSSGGQRAVLVQPGHRHWEILVDGIRTAGIGVRW